MYAALEGGGGEAPQVGDHASAEVDEQRMACGSLSLQLLPHMSEALQVLVVVAGRDDNMMCIGQAAVAADHGPAELLRGLVGEHQQTVRPAFLDSL